MNKQIFLTTLGILLIFQARVIWYLWARGVTPALVVFFAVVVRAFLAFIAVFAARQ